MTNEIGRRHFLSLVWKSGIALIGIAGAWTTWGLLNPKASGGFGGKVRAVPPDAVPPTGALAVPAARSYLVDIKGKTVALSQKCPHLGCRIAWCESSGEFECPCHGSVFNRAGDLESGPSPHGMNRYPVETGPDGMLYIDTGDTIEGPPPGTKTIHEPAKGPRCTSEGH